MVTLRSVHWCINPSLFLVKPPLKLANCPSPPFLGNPPLYIGFRDPPLKVGFFGESPKYLSFSSFTSSYFLKVTKFLGNMSQFEFLVMTEKNIFYYRLFLSLNILDFNLYFMWKLNPSLPPPLLKKVTPLFPSYPPQKVEILSSPPLLKIWLDVQPPPPPFP